MTEYQRPSGFDYERKDCTIRTFVTVTGVPYEKVHAKFRELGRKDRCGWTEKPHLAKLFKEFGFTAKQVKRSGSLRKLLTQFPKGKLYCIRRGHAFAIVDGVAIDENNLDRHIKGAWLITPILQNQGLSIIKSDRAFHCYICKQTKFELPASSDPFSNSFDKCTDCVNKEIMIIGLGEEND